MLVRVLYFARCRELAGCAEEQVELPEGATTAQLVELLSQARAPLGPHLATARIAVNREFAPPHTELSEGDEVAVIPPVSGGSAAPRLHFALSATPLGEQAAARCFSALELGAGAVCTFDGVVRGNARGHVIAHLEYEAFEPMVLEQLAKIAAECEAQWPIAALAVLHRVGVVEVGGVAVSIAVLSQRRAASFDACRHVIERLKADVPIWKKEVATDGTEWWGQGS
jgi:molybdopterin synthase catalytic subunit